MAWYDRPRRAQEFIAYRRLREGRILSLFLPAAWTGRRHLAQLRIIAADRTLLGTTATAPATNAHSAANEYVRDKGEEA